MFFRFVVLTLSILTLGCQEDLQPSSSDRRDIEEGSTGVQAGQIIDDFEYTLSTGATSSLTADLQTHDAVVYYFTMWCPVCTEHMQHIAQDLVTAYPDVQFYFVDYLTSSLNQTHSTLTSQGWQGFPTISDFNNALENKLDGTMAITVVVDKNYTVQLNEEFKNGSRLEDVLEAL